MRVAWETRADRVNPMRRMPNPRFGSALVQYCQHVQGARGRTRDGAISHDSAKCVPGHQLVQRARDSTKLNGCCLPLSVSLVPSERKKG